MPKEGLPPQGKFRVIVEHRPSTGLAVLERNAPFHLLSWPNMDPIPPDDRPQEVATERLYRQDTGQLAYPVGASYPIEELPQLCRHDARGHPIPAVEASKARSRNASKAR